MEILEKPDGNPDENPCLRGKYTYIGFFCGQLGQVRADTPEGARCKLATYYELDFRRISIYNIQVEAGGDPAMRKLRRTMT